MLIQLLNDNSSNCSKDFSFFGVSFTDSIRSNTLDDFFLNVFSTEYIRLMISSYVSFLEPNDELSSLVSVLNCIPDVSIVAIVTMAYNFYTRIFVIFSPKISQSLRCAIGDNRCRTLGTANNLIS